MLRDILASVRLDPRFCAELIRVPAEQFEGWLAGNRPIPKFAAIELAAIFGVPETELVSTQTTSRIPEPPAIWYKLRSADLADGDKEIVSAIRKLGFFAAQLRALQGQAEPRFVSLLNRVRGAVDRTASPTVQAKSAAAEFRRQDPALAHGAVGIGEYLRPRLRHGGFLVIETPIKNSKVEGCSFYSGPSDIYTPCLFANSYRSTWFRRNAVLAHELCHVIFDLDNEQISIDYKDEESAGVCERRAHVFAREFLVPKEVLAHFTSQYGINWANLTEDHLALLVASTHVEQKMVLDAALEAELIDPDLRDRYRSLDCGAMLRNISEHALETHEYMEKRGITNPAWKAELRRAKVGGRLITLPVGYVKEVLEALSAGLLTSSKASEMLLLDRYTFRDRFAISLPQRVA